MDELFILRYGQFERIPDLVVWPGDYIYQNKRIVYVVINKLESLKRVKLMLKSLLSWRANTMLL